MRVGKSEDMRSHLDWKMGVADQGEMRFPNCTAFGNGSRCDQDVFGYVVDYAVTEDAIFPPYEHIRCSCFFGNF